MSDPWTTLIVLTAAAAVWMGLSVTLAAVLARVIRERERRSPRPPRGA